MSLRCYNINCFYLAGIHAGIQSGHAQKELSVKYLLNKDHGQGPKAVETLSEYLEHHKTVVVLNGGMFGDLLKVEKFFGQPENTDYAWSAFRESEYALNNTLTNIAVVLPWHIYAFKSQIVDFMGSDYSAMSRVMDLAPGMTLILANGRLSLQVIFDHENGKAGKFEYSQFDIDLIKMIEPMKLMS